MMQKPLVFIGKTYNCNTREIRVGEKKMRAQSGGILFDVSEDRICVALTKGRHGRMKK